MKIGKYNIYIRRASWKHLFFDIVIEWEEQDVIQMKEDKFYTEYMKDHQQVFRWQMLLRFAYFGLGLFLGYCIGISIRM